MPYVLIEMVLNCTAFTLRRRFDVFCRTEPRGSAVLQFDLYCLSISYNVSVATYCIISKIKRDIDKANLSVCLSVRNVPVSDENGLTYRHSFFTTR